MAVLEGKGTRNPLDRPVAGQRMSAVDQAYRCAISQKSEVSGQWSVVRGQ